MKSLFLILLLFFAGVIEVHAGNPAAITVQLSARQSDGTLVHDLVTSLGVTDFNHIDISLKNHNTGETVTEATPGLIDLHDFTSNMPFITKLILNAAAFSTWSVGDIMTITVTINNPASPLNGVSASITFTKGPGVETFTNKVTPPNSIIFDVPAILPSFSCVSDQIFFGGVTEKIKTATIINASVVNTVERGVVGIATTIVKKENFTATSIVGVHMQEAILKDMEGAVAFYGNKLIYETSNAIDMIMGWRFHKTDKKQIVNV